MKTTTTKGTVSTLCLGGRWETYWPDCDDVVIHKTEAEAIRYHEFKVSELNAADSFRAYWAGSASASVARDYKAGRVRTVRAR